MGILTCLILIFEVVLLRYLRRKRGRPVRTSSKILVIVIGFAIIYTFVPAIFFGRKDAREIKRGKSELISLKLKGKPEEIEPLLPKGKLSIIGTTDKFLFFYGHDCKKCIIVPVANIGSISFNVSTFQRNREPNISLSVGRV